MLQPSLLRATLAACVLLTANLHLRADDPPPAQGRPMVAVQLRSFEDVLATITYVGKAIGQEDAVNQLEGLIKAFETPNGLLGINPKQPWVLYANLREDVGSSPIIVMLPITDQKTFLDALAGFSIRNRQQKDVYLLESDVLPIPVYARFANKQVYLTFQDKDNLALANLIKPEVLPKLPASTFAQINLNLNAIPKNLRQLAIGQIDLQLSEMKEAAPGEDKAVTELRAALIDTLSEKLALALESGSDLSLSIVVDRKKDAIGLEAKLTGTPGGQLQREIKGLVEGPGLFDLGLDNSAIRARSALAMPSKMLKSWEKNLDGLLESMVKDADNPIAKKAVKLLTDSLRPTLKTGQLVSEINVVGPAKNGKMGMVVAVRGEQMKQVEQSVRQIVKLDPVVKAFIATDVGKVGTVTYHKITPGPDAADSKTFGDGPYFLAVPSDNVAILTLGQDAEALLKRAIPATKNLSKEPLLLQFDIAYSRAALVLDPNDADQAQKARDYFKNSPPGSDRIRVELLGGEDLTVRVLFSTKLLGLAAQQAGFGEVENKRD
jgi:hypothetical protein